MKGYKNVGMVKQSQPPADRGKRRQEKFLLAQRQADRAQSKLRSAAWEKTRETGGILL